jgi:hypothetical protein
MTHFLVSDENPNGHRLESILSEIRKDIIQRANKIIADDRPEARHVLENNIKILGMLSECIGYAEDSTRTLDKSFGPSKEGLPRIGNV